MPYSYSQFKNEVRDHIVDNFPSETRFLDVGAGSGAYGQLLKPHYKNIDALEIFPNYIEMFNLRDIYRTVFEGDIRDFDMTFYDYILLGDIVEHLTVDDAKSLLNKIHCKYRKKMLVAVPYMFEQGEEYGNIYETHHQPDLSVTTFYRRYPMMKLIYGDKNYGYFINYTPPIK